MNVKSLLHSKSIQFIVAVIIVSYVRLIRLTSKTSYINIKHLENAKKDNHNLIFAFWHGRELMMTSYLENQGQIFSIVSLHKDGDLVNMIVKLFNSKALRGSSTKGGQSVLRQILRELKKPNHHLCITPDGPVGPRMEVSGAVIDIARLSGAKILPIACSAKKAKFLNSWDLFMIPRLFNHITVEFGEAVMITRDTKKDDLKTIKQTLETSLNNMTWKLDEKYGREKVKSGKMKQKNDKDI